MLSGPQSASWRHSAADCSMPSTALGVQGHGAAIHSHTLSSETLASMYDHSTDRSRGVASEAGSLQQQSSMLKNASDPSLRSAGSSFADLESAGYTRHGYQRHEEQDIFSAVGGMDLGADAELDSLGAELASTSSQEPYSEPSRTLFVRHINPAAADEELLTMFKVFGDVRHMYTISKHRGFVMVTYFDLRAAVQAQAALSGVPVSTSAPLEMHFCAPKGDPTVSQGTVTLFNLDPNTSNEHLAWLFSKFGDVRDCRESPDRRNQKFITFYDTRHALAALRAMNKAEHLGKLPANITPQLAASMSQSTMHDPAAAAAAMEASQRGQAGAWDAQHSAEMMMQAQLAARGSGSRTSSQPGTTSPSPLPGTSPAGQAFMPQARSAPQEALVSPAIALKFQQQHHGHGQVQGMPGGPQSLEHMAAGSGAAELAGIRTGMHVSDSASSMSSVGQTANQIFAAAAGRSPLGSGAAASAVMLVPHGHATHMAKPMPSLATLSEEQAGLYAAAGTMLAGGAAGGMDPGSASGSGADVNAAANMLMNLQLSAAAAAGGQAATPEQQLWALQQMAGASSQGQAAGVAGQAGMWGSFYGGAAGMPGAAAAANLQALRLQQGLQELQVRQQQQQQQHQLAMAANLASLQGQTLSSVELNAAAAQLLHIAGLGGALSHAASNPYLPSAGAGLGVAGLSAAGLGGSAGNLGALTNAAAAQQLLQQAMAMGNVGALNALGGMQAAALAGQAGAAAAAGRLGGSFGTLASALAAQQAAAAAAAAAGHGIHHPHHIAAAGSRDGGAGSRGGGRLSRRTTDPAAELERKLQQEKLYALDAVKIRSGEDKRTTLMIKNIPNKYTQKMLLATVDEQFKGTYDFFYLPIDFKNKCNVGYAFINMINPFDIIGLVERFNNRRWERFNSEKVCNISYARIQGRAALVAHFQNSSLMHEDKRCRPILFTANGTESTDAEAFQNDPSLQPVPSSGTISATGTTGGLGGGASSSSASLTLSASSSQQQLGHTPATTAGPSAGGSSSATSGGGGNPGATFSCAGAGAATSTLISTPVASAAAGMSGPARLRAAAAAAAAAASAAGGSGASGSFGYFQGAPEHGGGGFACGGPVGASGRNSSPGG